LPFPIALAIVPYKRYRTVSPELFSIYTVYCNHSVNPLNLHIRVGNVYNDRYYTWGLDGIEKKGQCRWSQCPLLVGVQNVKCCVSVTEIVLQLPITNYQ